MTNHDSNHEVRKPNYTLRRIKTLIAVIGFVSSVTLLFTWRTADSQSATVLVSVIYLLTGLWLAIRFATRDDDTDSSTHPVGRHGESRDN